MINCEWHEVGVYRRFVGVVHVRDFARADRELHASPRFDDLHYLIDDFTACEGVQDIHAAALAERAAIESVAVRFPERFHHAMISGSAQINAMIDGFMQSGLFRHRLCRFDSLADAQAWVLQSLR